MVPEIPRYKSVNIAQVGWGPAFIGFMIALSCVVVIFLTYCIATDVPEVQTVWRYLSPGQLLLSWLQERLTGLASCCALLQLNQWNPNINIQCRRRWPYWCWYTWPTNWRYLNNRKIQGTGVHPDCWAMLLFLDTISSGESQHPPPRRTSLVRLLNPRLKNEANVVQVSTR